MPNYGRRADDQIQVAAMEPPWVGVVSSVPHIISPLNGVKDARQFLINAGRLITRPSLLTLTNPTDGLTPLASGMFQDENNFYHAFVLTAGHAYFVTFGPFTYHALSSYTIGTAALPISWVASYRKVYFTSPGQPLQYMDGSSAVQVAEATLSARFLATLGGHIIMAYTTESAVDYPYRIRWSISGDPTDWSGFGSGIADLVEVGDNITGLFCTSYYGYIFREKGITVMIPTGQSNPAFALEPLTTGVEGIGNIIPYCLGVYGSQAIFPSSDDLYMFDSEKFTPVGGLARTAIYNDLYAGGINQASAKGIMVPYLAQSNAGSYATSVSNLGPFYILAPYHVATKLWVYSLRDNAWMPWSIDSTFTNVSSLGMIPSA